MLQILFEPIVYCYNHSSVYKLLVILEGAGGVIQPLVKYELFIE